MGVEACTKSSLQICVWYERHVSLRLPLTRDVGRVRGPYKHETYVKIHSCFNGVKLDGLRGPWEAQNSNNGLLAVRGSEVKERQVAESALPVAVAVATVRLQLRLLRFF